MSKRKNKPEIAEEKCPKTVEDTQPEVTENTQPEAEQAQNTSTEATTFNEALLQTKDEALLNKLSQIESLLQSQEQTSQKVLFWRRFSSGATLSLVVVLCLGIFWVMNFFQTNLSGLPELIESTNLLISQVNEMDFEALNEGILQLNEVLKSIDFESLNEGIRELEEGLRAVDFSALNELIQSLKVVSERLEAVANIFG